MNVQIALPWPAMENEPLRGRESQKCPIYYQHGAEIYNRVGKDLSGGAFLFFKILGLSLRMNCKC
jgi:hypothetical protein